MHVAARFFSAVLVVLISMPASGQQVRLDRSALPTGAFDTIEAMNVRGADLRDVLRGIAMQYELNLIVDNDIDDRVTVRLADLPVIDAVLFLVEEYGLELDQRGSIIRLRRTPVPEPEPLPLSIEVSTSLLSVDLNDAPLDAVIRRIAEGSGRNIMVRQGLSGSVSGRFRDVAPEEGLRALLANNGFVLREREGGILVVDRSGSLSEGTAPGSGIFVSAKDNLLELELTNAPVMDVLREIASQLSLKLVTYGSSENVISARASGLTVDQALTYLFRGTNLTHRKDGDVYVVADRQAGTVSTSRLIRLNHARSAGMADLIPPELRQRAAIQVIKEQNGLMVQASSDVIYEIEQFVAQLDRRSPQILIEALVVDFEDLDELDIGFRFGLRDIDSTHIPGHWRFGAGREFDRGFSASARGERIDRELNPVRNLLGLRTIGHLPADFYLQIQALERAGKAKVVSRPQIATLNGHPASISVGTTQYYILRTTSPVPPGGQYFPIESERFERVEAHVRLEVVPWVTEAGDVNAEIRPEFSTPVGALDPRVPPTINTRQLETTVRLRDGETIILGGLIQESRVNEQSMVPVLGRIPILGKLFRSRKSVRRKSELVIYITPHVFYGDERDEAKWEGMREHLGLTDPELRRSLGYTLVD
jgi:type IV pilus assembly protein PilQ